MRPAKVQVSEGQSLSTQGFLRGLSWSVILVGMTIALAVTPFAVRLVPLSDSPKSFQTFVHGTAMFDLFHGFKAMTLQVGAALSLIGLCLVIPFDMKKMSLARLQTWWKGTDRHFWLLAAAWTLACSAGQLLTEYPDVIWHGGLTQFDGLQVQWSYCGLLVAGFFVGRRKDLMRIMIVCLGFATVLLATIGWFDLKNISLSDFSWFVKAVTPAVYDNQVKLERIFFAAIVGMFGNPNYVAFYGAMLVPFWSGLTLWSLRPRSQPQSQSQSLYRAFNDSKSLLKTFVYAVLTSCAVFIGLGSAGAAGGMSSVLALLVLGALGLQKNSRATSHGLARMGLAFGIGYFAISLFQDPILGSVKGKALQLVDLATQISSTLKSKPDSNPLQQMALQTAPLAQLAQIVVKAKEVAIGDAAAGHTVQASLGKPKEGAGMYLKGAQLFIEQWDPGLIVERAVQGIRFMDLGFRPLKLKKMGENFTIDRDGYSDIRIHQVHDSSVELYQIAKGNDSLTIGNTPQGLRVLTNRSLIAPIKGRRLPWAIDDHLLSQRIYIWFRVLPLIGDRWLLGHGSGAFMLDFPNRDLVSMGKVFGTTVFVDRPHNMYLQVAYNCGLLGLGLFLVILFGSLWRATKQVWSAPEFDPVQAALMLSLVAAAFAGLAYDLTVGYAGTFWLLLGALNGKIHVNRYYPRSSSAADHSLPPS